jgi:hypothetical protein
MSIKIEFRYAVLTTLVVLLWLVIEYAIGLQDNYVAFHPYVSMLMMILIPSVTYRLAINEKLDKNFDKLSFRQVFVSGVLITVFSCLLAVPVQLGFHKLINPGFFETMILYTSQHTGVTVEQAAEYFNLKTYMAESILFTFVIGIIISVVLAFRMRTVK